MVIDGRRLRTRELFLVLRDALKMEPGHDVSIELLVDKECDFMRVRAFLRMSGCRAEMEERDGHHVVRISGGCSGCR
jgi:hypothetical protein